MRLPFVFLLSLLGFSGIAATQQPHPTVVSPEVHADNTVTLRFAAPNAKEVKLGLEGAEPQPMQKNDQGLWTITTAPLPPDYYGYSFLADGVRSLDPLNHNLVAKSAHSRKFCACPRPPVPVLGTQRCATRRDPPSLLQINRREG